MESSVQDLRFYGHELRESVVHPVGVAYSLSSAARRLSAVRYGPFRPFSGRRRCLYTPMHHDDRDGSGGDNGEMDYGTLKSRVDALVGELLSGFREKYGYDPGEHRLEFARPGEDASLLLSVFGDYLPAEVEGFFRNFAELALPDVWNGFFIGPPSWIVSVYEAAEPRAVEEPGGAREVIVVGSDGGGGLFACLRSRESPIYLLPPSRISEGNYVPLRGASLEALRVADTFESFLEDVISRLEQTAHA